MSDDLIKCDGMGVLKCDACDWKDDKRIKLDESFIDMPCPKCGANVMTQENFVHAETLFGQVELVNRVARAQGIKFADDAPRAHKLARVSADGVSFYDGEAS